MSISNAESTPLTIRQYLIAAYEVDEDRAKQLVHEHEEIVRKAVTFRSFAYYAGDAIATAAGLVERDGWEEADNDMTYGEEW